MMRQRAKQSGIVLSAFALCVAAYAYAVAETPVLPSAQDQQAGLMLAKLASSQKILNGLVSKDFHDVKRGSEELIRILDAMEWSETTDQVYSHHRTELRRLTQKLTRSAEDQNLDGASFTYMHALTVCISCHEHCRDVLKIADVELVPTPSSQRVVPIPVEESEASRIYEAPVRR